jgi:beta-glucanase (GH16 family)
MRFCLLPFFLLATQANTADWQLVWSDEFNDSKLDYSKWGVSEDAFGGGNQESQLYTDRAKNVRVENGKLIIEAHRDSPNIQGTQRQYSSGKLRTKHRGDWRYGKIEIRAKLPIGKGIWPAIWMLPTDEKYGTWAASGEIDIVELNGAKPDELLGTLHYGGKWPHNRSTGHKKKLVSGTFADEFHTFGIEWEAAEIRWTLNGKTWQTQKKWSTRNAPFPAPFDQRFHLLLNIAVGGRLVGNPSATTPFPARMEVDWIRVYQRK